MCYRIPKIISVDLNMLPFDAVDDSHDTPSRLWHGHVNEVARWDMSLGLLQNTSVDRRKTLAVVYALLQKYIKSRISYQTSNRVNDEKTYCITVRQSQTR